MKWKLEFEESYFRIYDSNKQIAGYFDPDYGAIFPPEKEVEVIEQMHKNHDKISGGFLHVPMLKFGIFDSDYQSSIDGLENQITSVNQRIAKWKEFLSEIQNKSHMIRISHTDQDMLSMTFPFKFSKPTPLDKNEILNEIMPILDLMNNHGLL